MRTLLKYGIRDKHTGGIVGRYKTERSAQYAASKLCDKWGKKRYSVVSVG